MLRAAVVVAVDHISYYRLLSPDDDDSLEATCVDAACLLDRELMYPEGSGEECAESESSTTAGSSYSDSYQSVGAELGA